MIIMDKICKGCLIYERHIKDPHTYRECNGRIFKDTKCPCQNCLIKMICDTPCELLIEREWHLHTVIKNIKETSNG
jgi:hypothetical protein